MERRPFQFTDDVVTLAVSRCAGALLSRGFELSFSRRFSVKLMYAFNSAAIFLPGHTYIEY